MNELGMNSTIFDTNVFFKMTGDILKYMCATYVDDNLHAGDKNTAILHRKQRVSSNVSQDNRTICNLL